MVCWTVSEHSVRSGLSPAVAKPKAADDEGRDAQIWPPTETGDPSCQGDATVSCGRACVAEETMPSLGRRGKSIAACGPVGGPSAVLDQSEGSVESYKEEPLANCGREHPGPEGWPPLSRRTRGGNGSTPLWQLDPPLPKTSQMLSTTFG